MPKPRYIRKKQIDSDNEQESPDQAESPSQVSETIEELQELRKMRRKHGGIDTEKLLKGTEKKKKKKKTSTDPWGLHTLDAVRRGNEDEEGTEKKLKLDTFTTQTNALDVDKHMQVMAYIEEEMRKRRGEAAEQDEEEETTQNNGPIDIYEELYRIPDRLKLDQKRVEEGSMQLSTQMLTAIPEVDLGIDVRLKNIEETERAKRRYMDEEAAKSDRSEDEGDEVPANYEKQIVKQHKQRHDRRQMASDEIVAERFKKRMRK